MGIINAYGLICSTLADALVNAIAGVIDVQRNANVPTENLPGRNGMDKHNGNKNVIHVANSGVVVQAKTNVVSDPVPSVVGVSVVGASDVGAVFVDVLDDNDEETEYSVGFAYNNDEDTEDDDWWGTF